MKREKKKNGMVSPRKKWTLRTIKCNRAYKNCILHICMVGWKAYDTIVLDDLAHSNYHSNWPTNLEMLTNGMKWAQDTRITTTKQINTKQKWHTKLFTIFHILFLDSYFICICTYLFIFFSFFLSKHSDHLLLYCVNMLFRIVCCNQLSA